MTLSPGTRLGPYEITGAIGAGGMGEVFRARDTKLNREVAIKVLPAAFADDPERLARFTREAQTLASLNHPNIAAIYGIEEIASSASSDDFVAMTTGVGASRALVMELVEGEDLSVHIARGPIPIAEALPIARQIAEALEAAHEQGIVHRDLKPANIKVRTDGTVKVLDFGLAKAMDSSGPSSPNVSHSPTLTHQGTMAGMIIGTAAYMSPEQAKGKTIDKRTDIWAFGVVLYEMLTGSRLFAAEDVSETLAAVLTRDVNLKALPPGTPARLRALVSDCLIRDSKQRLRDIGNARIEIARIEAGAPGGSAPVSTTAVTAIVPIWRRALPWALASAFAIAFAYALALLAPWQPAPVPTPRKLLGSIGADASLNALILSPDGTTLAFSALRAGERRLFIRRLDQLEASALAGTEGAAFPFFSPDGQWIAFFAGGKLKKVSASGGAVVTLCDTRSARGGTWLEDDMIIFAPWGGPDLRLVRVPAAGGTPSAFGTFGEGAVTQRWPHALPGGKGVLYSENSSITGWDRGNLVVASLAGGTPKVVVRGGYHGRYLPSGHLVYMQQGTLFAVPFDLSRLETTGQAVPALEGISSSAVAGDVQMDISSDGTLVHLPGGTKTLNNPIDWLTRDGKTSPLLTTRVDWETPRFSPDGRKLALSISDGKQRDIWVYEWTLDRLTQLTFDPGADSAPVWTLDGRRIAFSSDRAKPGVRNLYWMNADGTGEVTRLTDSPEDQWAQSWHESGKYLAFSASRGAASWDLMILPMERDSLRGLVPGKPTVFLSTPVSELYPTFSPDGRWIAYVSNETGNGDIYVRPFPGPGGPWRISTEGGNFPLWSTSGNELLFSKDSQVMVAPYSVAGDSFRAERPRLWAPRGIRGVGTTVPYALHPDGKRLAIVAWPAANESEGVVDDKVVFFFNFGEYLKKIAPVTKP